MSPRTPEADARRDIDRQLEATGWIVQDRAAVNVHGGPGVAGAVYSLAVLGLRD